MLVFWERQIVAVKTIVLFSESRYQHSCNMCKRSAARAEWG